MSESYEENQFNQTLQELVSFADSINFFILMMTLNEFFMTVSMISTNASVAAAHCNETTFISLISLHKKKNVSSFKDLLRIVNEYDFVRNARPYLKNRDKYLIHAAASLMAMYGMIEGKFCMPWKEILNVRQGKMCQKLAEKASWLLYFEQEWASDWILFCLINQQIWDWNWKKRQDSDTSDDHDTSDDSDNDKNQNEMTDEAVKARKKSED